MMKSFVTVETKKGGLSKCDLIKRKKKKKQRKKKNGTKFILLFKSEPEMEVRIERNR